MIELLAPAGNLEILKAAVDCGADAVYCGMSAFNARINAGNLTLEEFREGASYCHYRGSRIYLTLNTLIGDAEFDDAVYTAVSAYEAGCDGILIQDVGLASVLHEKYPAIPIHCSTQMNIFSDSDFKAISELGFRRVVLPRELSVQEIAKRSKIASRYKIETEVFAHGAVCVCYSGLCLFSAMNRSGSRSGNRGLCAQPCREEYTLYSDGKEIRTGHLLSPKDRDVLAYISELVQSGVSSLKIEGRMRDKNYVMSAVTSYRRIIDSYYDGELDKSLVKEVTNDLLVNFNRGGEYTSQFLSGQKQNDFLSGEYPGKYGLRIGKVLRSDAKKGTLTLSFKPGLPMPEKGDFLSVRRNEKEICSFPVGKIHEMPDSIAVKGLHPDMISKLDIGSEVYLMGHQTRIDNKDIRKTPITLSVDVTDTSILCNASIFEGDNSGVFAEYEVDLPGDFEGSALPKERIISQLMKTGDSPFKVQNVYFTGTDSVACPVSLINELRRGVVYSLIGEIDQNYERSLMAEFVEPKDVADKNRTGNVLVMHTYPFIKDDPSKVKAGADIYAFSVFEMNIKAVREKIIAFMRGNNASLCLLLPDLYHDRTSEMINDVARMLKDALGDRLCYYMDSRIYGRNKELTEIGLKHLLSGGANIYNCNSFEYSSRYCDGVSMSHELSGGEIIEILSGATNDNTVVLHTEGMIPWMQSDFCPVGGNKVKCGKCYENSSFTMKSHNMDDSVCVLPHSFDCSSTIYGNAKNLCGDTVIDSAIARGFDVIANQTII